jgi:polysaccharide pyruvyl transferase WcaK-like protein
LQRESSPDRVQLDIRVPNLNRMTSKEPSLQLRSSPDAAIRCIGLLSPYSGGNLGNAAIISAMIANIRMRLPDAEIVGITLNPENTRLRHGIASFPLTGVSRPYYSLCNTESSNTNPQASRKRSAIKQWLKRIPLVVNFLRTIRLGWTEVAHILGAARLVRKLDRLIVPGGGALDEFWGGPWGHPWTLFKWSVICRLCGVPFLFVSVGKSSLERPLSRFFVRNALRLARYRSYRDADSKTALQSIIDAQNDPVFPDLAFSYPLPAFQVSQTNGSNHGPLLIGVSPIAFCDPRAWPLKDQQRYDAYIKSLAAMANWLLKEGHSLLFFTTDSPDSSAVQDVQAAVDPSSNAGLIRTFLISGEHGMDQLLEAIAATDLIIASRLHGVILSHLNAIPVLALSFDPKVDSHMSAVGQKEYSLNIDHLPLETLIERFSALNAVRPREQANLRCAARTFRDRLDQQYDFILGAPRCRSILNPSCDQAHALF